MNNVIALLFCILHEYGIMSVMHLSATNILHEATHLIFIDLKNYFLKNG